MVAITSRTALPLALIETPFWRRLLRSRQRLVLDGAYTILRWPFSIVPNSAAAS